MLMKFDIWKDIVSRSYFLKSRPDLVTLGLGDLKSWKTLTVKGLG